MNLAQRSLELLEAGRVLTDEFMIENLARPASFRIEDFFHQSFQQRHIAVDANLQE